MRERKSRKTVFEKQRKICRTSEEIKRWNIKPCEEEKYEKCFQQETWWKWLWKKLPALFSLFILFFPYFFFIVCFSISIPYGKKGVETRSFHGKFFIQLERVKKILKRSERERKKKGEKRREERERGYRK